MTEPSDFTKKAKSEFSVNRDVLIGYFIVFVFFCGSTLWAATLPLNSAAIAPGVIGVDGNRKLLQHLEGGIVEKIRIKEGDFVNAGQVLISLEKDSLLAKHRSIDEKLLYAKARLARWDAEKNNLEELSFEQLRAEFHIPENSHSLQVQREVFDASLELYRKQELSLTSQIDRSKSEIKSDSRRLKSLKKRRSLVQNELNDYREFEINGLVTRSKLFTLRNQISDNDVMINDTQAQITESREDIDYFKSQMAELAARRQQEATEKLDQLQDEISVLTQKSQLLADQLRRTDITAPISGYVVGLKVHTESGVVGAGEPLLEIVPSQSKLVVTARVDPKDRDNVEVGQSADIHFSAFSRRTTIPTKGRVKTISADGIVDGVGQQSFYEAQIEIVEDVTKVDGSSGVHPGMQAEVIILTGNRTLLDYLVSPISRSFNLALREQ